MAKHIGDHIKVVLLDHDDTLVGTINNKWKHHKHVAKKYYGKDLTDKELETYWGKPLSELVCVLYGTDDVEQAMANNTACHEDFPKELFTFSIPVLGHIKDSGRLIGIITATSRFSFEHDLELHKIPRNLLDYTQTAEDTLFHKPDHRVFDPALDWIKGLQFSPAEVLYVGDGLHDMHAALGAGFSFMGVETGLVTRAQFSLHGAESVPNIGHLA